MLLAWIKDQQGHYIEDVGALTARKYNLTTYCKCCGEEQTAVICYDKISHFRHPWGSKCPERLKKWDTVSILPEGYFGIYEAKPEPVPRHRYDEPWEAQKVPRRKPLYYKNGARVEYIDCREHMHHIHLDPKVTWFVTCSTFLSHYYYDKYSRCWKHWIAKEYSCTKDVSRICVMVNKDQVYQIEFTRNNRYGKGVIWTRDGFWKHKSSVNGGLKN